MKPFLIIIRGLPGSGKTTLAKGLLKCIPGLVHCEADHYFHKQDGSYKFDATKLHLAHEACQNQAMTAMEEGKPIVVSNTFTQVKEMAPYLEYACLFNYDIKVLTANGKWPNVHNVPETTCEAMKARWETFDLDKYLADFRLRAGRFGCN